MSAHTKGPWLVAETPGGFQIVGDVRPNGFIVVAREVDDKDDAAVLAAAPDLLEALKDAANRLRGAGMLGGSCDPVSAAIAKAEHARKEIGQ